MIISEPPSTSTDTISLLPSFLKRSLRLTLPFLSFFTTNTSTPCFFIAAIFPEGALDVVAIIVKCVLASVRTDDLTGIRSLLSTITRKGFFPFTCLTVNCGLSATAVPAPTIIPIFIPRRRWTYFRDASELIHCESPLLVAILPSSVWAYLTVM